MIGFVSFTDNKARLSVHRVGEVKRDPPQGFGVQTHAQTGGSCSVVAYCEPVQPQPPRGQTFFNSPEIPTASPLALRDLGMTYEGRADVTEHVPPLFRRLHGQLPMRQGASPPRSVKTKNGKSRHPFLPLRRPLTIRLYLLFNPFNAMTLPCYSASSVFRAIHTLT